jgi:outer membrane cobalamin receptor
MARHLTKKKSYYTPNRNMSGTLLPFFFTFFTLIATAQTPITIYGTVQTANGEALIGAKVSAGTDVTMTKDDGTFQLVLYKAERTLTVKYIGFANATLPITDAMLKGEKIIVKLAEEASLLQTATVTSGKFEKPLGEVTVSLDVLRPSLIENVNTQKIDDALTKVSGVTVIDGQANIRGGSGYSYGAGSRVLLLLDDIPLLQPDAGLPNWRDIPVENIEQIEVIKGAASALYGSSAMNGVINIRTGFAKSKPETRISVAGTAYLNPQDTLKKWWTSSNQPYQGSISASHKQKFGALDLTANAFYFNNRSWNDSTYDKYGRFGVSLRYRLSDRMTIGANVNYNKGEASSFFYWKNDSIGIMRPGTAPTVNTRLRYNIDPYFTYFDNSGNQHKILGRYYLVDNSSESGNQSNYSTLYYGEYQFQRRWVEQQLVFTTGVVGTFTNLSAPLYGDTSYSSRNLAIYAQADKKFGDRLNLSFGVRFEDNLLRSPEVISLSPFAKDTVKGGRAQESKPVFRIGANYQAAKFTYLRASIGQGYRFPTVAEKFVRTNVGFDIYPNPRLTSETGWTAEIGAKQGFALGELKGFVDVAAFWSQYDNMMEFTFTNKFGLGFQSQNVGNTVIKGFEVSMAAQGKMGDVQTSVLLGYTYIDPQYRNFTVADTVSGSVNYNVLKYRYKHNAKLDIDLSAKHWSAGVAVQYWSHMESIDRLFTLFIGGLRNFRTTHNNGTTVVDLRVAYKPTENIKISLIAANLLNEEYALRPALLDAPRNLSARLDFKF